MPRADKPPPPPRVENGLPPKPPRERPDDAETQHRLEEIQERSEDEDDRSFAALQEVWKQHADDRRFREIVRELMEPWLNRLAEMEAALEQLRSWLQAERDANDRLARRVRRLEKDAERRRLKDEIKAELKAEQEK